jgi:hypothetical protein
MSTVHYPERPAFNSLEPGLDSDVAPPVSNLAIICMVLGILSLTAAISVSIAPFAVVVAVLSAVMTWRLSWDSSLSGLRLAQIGLCCAVIGCTWSFTAKRMTEAYLYKQAAEHAKLFLETLSAGKKYEAFELTQEEALRQVTGTDIEAHYQNLISTVLPKRAEMSSPEEMPSPETMKQSQAKGDLEAFLNEPITKELLERGGDSEWIFVRGAGIARKGGSTVLVSVVMVDKARPSKSYEVELKRDTGGYVKEAGKPPVAMWDINTTKAVKE